MIIHIDPVDELNTIVHKMRMEQDGQILVVVPKDNRILHDPINVKLLAKYAKELQKEIAVQTNDPVVIELAEANKITAIKETSAAAKEEEDEEKEALHTKKRRKVYRQFGYDKLFVLLVIAASILGLAYYHLPKAIIVVTPQVLDFEKDLVFSLSELDGVEIVAEKQVLTGQTPTTGRKTVGVTSAEGFVTLINHGRSDVLVKKGALVETKTGIKFTTMNDVKVPAVTVNYLGDLPIGSAAGMVEVAIAAIEPGSKGNVINGSIEIIRNYDLDVRNINPTMGGEDIVFRIAAKDDIEKAQSMAIRDGERKLNASLQEQVGERLVLNDTFEMKIEWTDMSTVGEETSDVYVSGICVGQVYMLDAYKLSEHVSELLSTEIPSGFIIDADTIVFDNLRLINNEDLQMSISAWAVIHGTVDSISLADELAGKDRSELETVIDSYPTIAGIYIESGVGDKLPKLPRWLRIKVEQPIY